MNDSSNSEAATSIALTIIDRQKLRLPSVYVALPPEFVSNLGGVIIAWGMFEQSFKSFLEAMIRKTGSIFSGWEYSSFERQHRIFNQELRTCFDGYPNIVEGLSRILDESLPLQIKRNVLTHGKLEINFNNAQPQIIARGRHKKLDFVDVFTTDSIDNFYYELIHLAGRMRMFVSPMGLSFSPPLSSEEISALKDFLIKNLHSHSIQSMILPLPDKI